MSIAASILALLRKCEVMKFYGAHAAKNKACCFVVPTESAIETTSLQTDFKASLEIGKPVSRNITQDVCCYKCFVT
jgi:hypothetical protein